MRWAALRVALLLVIGLAVTTVALNVRCTHYQYRLGVVMHDKDDMLALIASRRAQCEKMLSTDELVAFLDQIGAKPDDLNRILQSPGAPAVAMQVGAMGRD